MTIRVASAEIARKGMRYRPLKDGTFELTSSVTLRGSAAAPGRVLATDNFFDMILLAPGVDVLEANIRFQGASGLSNAATGTYGLAVHDAVTAVPGVFATGLVAGQLNATASAIGQSASAAFFARSTNTGTSGAGTFLYTPSAIPANLNAPRAVPLPTTGLTIRGASQIPTPAGTRLVRFRVVAAPSGAEQAAAILADRNFTVSLVCAPAAGYIGTPTQTPYDFEEAVNGSHGLFSP